MIGFSIGVFAIFALIMFTMWRKHQQAIDRGFAYTPDPPKSDSCTDHCGDDFCKEKGCVMSSEVTPEMFGPCLSKRMSYDQYLKDHSDKPFRFISIDRRSGWAELAPDIIGRVATTKTIGAYSYAVLAGDEWPRPLFIGADHESTRVELVNIA